MKRIGGVIAALLIVSGVFAVAQAADSTMLRVTLRHDLTLKNASYPRGRTLITLPALKLQAGEARLVLGHLRAVNRSTSSANEQVGISCDYGNRVEHVRTSRNNLGARVRYSRGRGVLEMNVRYLVAVVNAQTVRCSLWGQSSGDAMVAMHGSGTYIEVSKAAQPRAVQWLEGRCDSHGSGSGCVYLVRRSIHQRGTRFPDHAYALVNDTFVADLTATAADILGDVEFTTCYRHTSSCSSRASRYGGGDSSAALVETRLEAYQLDMNGEPCGVTTMSPAPGHGDGTHRDFARWHIPHEIHHYKIHMELLHPLRVNPACTRRFLVRLFVRSVGGDPVKIEGSRTDTIDRRTHTRAYTNAIARNVY